MYRLLLVDDEEMVLVSIHHSVNWTSNQFSQVLETTDARDAMRILDQNRIDCAIVDIRMPGYSAFDLIEHCQRKKIQPTFVILSGYSDFQYAQKAVTLGVFDYLLKPLQPDECENWLPRLTKHLWEKKLLDDPDICQQLYSGQNLETLLPWLGVRLNSPWIGILYIYADTLSADYLAVLEKFKGITLLYNQRECILFISADSDPSEDIENHVQKLMPPCGISLHIIGRDISLIPAALAHARIEATDAFSKSLSLRKPCFFNNGYKKTPAKDDLFFLIVREIESRFREDLALSDLAERYHISYAYLSNLFHQRLGMTFSQYLRSLRLREAKLLLVQTLLPINLISEQIGYPDYHHFERIFRREFHMTPSEFRKTERQQHE